MRRVADAASARPGPAATTLPHWDRAFATSGITIPVGVFSSASISFNASRSPLGLNICFSLRLPTALREHPRANHRAAFRLLRVPLQHFGRDLVEPVQHLHRAEEMLLPLGMQI